MGILEVHFHDSSFEWDFAGGGESGENRSLSLGSGGQSEQSEQPEGRPPILPKLRSAFIVGLVVVLAMAYNRRKERRERERAEAESPKRRSMLSRLR